MDNNSFKEYLEGWKVSPNLSNQNFHNKLIRSLVLSHDVDVISVRSINKLYKHKTLEAKIVKEGNVFWKYPLVKRNRIDKKLKLFRRVKHITMHDSEYVFVDVLNLSLLKCALKYADKYGMKIIGVCTDSPNNISFLRKGYKKKLLELGQLLDGYIVLTDKIAELYNVRSRPCLKIDGINESIKEYAPRKIEGNYFYFGGSLMENYGILNLVEAFKKLERNDVKLVICGHHLEKNKLYNAIDNNPNIYYLGPMSYEDNLSLIHNSLALVNPRPQNDKIDNYSIPSKVLESLAAESLTITVDNPLLKEHYEPCFIWAKSNEPDDLLEAMKRVLSFTRVEREMLVILGKNKAMQYTSLEIINKQIDEELLSKFSLD